MTCPFAGRSRPKPVAHARQFRADTYCAGNRFANAKNGKIRASAKTGLHGSAICMQFQPVSTGSCLMRRKGGRQNCGEVPRCDINLPLKGAPRSLLIGLEFESSHSKAEGTNPRLAPFVLHFLAATIVGGLHAQRTRTLDDRNSDPDHHPDPAVSPLMHAGVGRGKAVSTTTT